MSDTLDRYAPQGLAVLRIITGLLFMQHGLQKMFHFPDAGHHPEPFVILSIAGIAGVLETFGGAAIVLGLFTRGVAFVLAGEMAVAYFAFHLQALAGGWRGFFPVINGGDSAILFCFVFLDLVFAGPGAWSADSLRRQSRD
jgi:putative oxidoreductase